MSMPLNWDILLEPFPGGTNREKLELLQEEEGGSVDGMAHTLGIATTTMRGKMLKVGLHVPKHFVTGGDSKDYKAGLDAMLEEMRIEEGIPVEEFRKFLKTKRGQYLLGKRQGGG